MWRALLLLTCLSLGSCAGLTRYFESRGLDLADCVKCNVGGGLGLSLDVRCTDWISPAVGVSSYAWCVGYEDREIAGIWNEFLVIHTPRAIWELNYGDPDQPEEPGISEESRAVRLFTSSMLLANERWIRHPGGSPITVEYSSLFNIGQIGEKLRASSPAHYMLEEGEEARTRHKSAWRKGFLEVGAMLLVVEARVGVNPLEFVDFVCGLVGFDPAGDDV